MLIVEGPDMVGKTEFCGALARRLAEVGMADVRRDKFGLPESERMLEACRERVRPRTVCDRGWLSEMVYGHVCRDRPRVTQEDSERIEELVQAANGLVVMLTADDAYETLIQQHHKRGEAFTVPQCRAAALGYAELNRRGAIFDMHVRWSEPKWQNGRPNGKWVGRGVKKVHYATTIDDEGNVYYPSADGQFVDYVARTYAELQAAAP